MDILVPVVANGIAGWLACGRISAESIAKKAPPAMRSTGYKIPQRQMRLIGSR